MEVYYYRCAQCGYIHQVPSYWMGYAPEEGCEQMHRSPSSGMICENTMLAYTGEGNED